MYNTLNTPYPVCNRELYTSPSRRSSASSWSIAIARSGEMLGERDIYRPLVSPSSPSGLADLDGEREMYRPSEFIDDDRDLSR